VPVAGALGELGQDIAGGGSGHGTPLLRLLSKMYRTYVTL
jgi:hypothetical protein